MHKEILTKNQAELLPVLKIFSQDFGLVGGTAFALYLGHRRSIDFDLFSAKEFKNTRLQNKILKSKKINQVIVSKLGEYTLVIDRVKFTFFHYPFAIDFSEKFDNWIKIPDLLTLAAMKAYALGYRAKWKDYVDLSFVFQKYSYKQITEKADQIFGEIFNEKLFREQLVYFKDINYVEKVEFLPGFEISDDKIKKVLIEASLSR